MTLGALYPEAHLVRQTGTSTTAADYRTPFRRDYARLVHSAAFRRLGGKTQLFPTNENALFRNRLSHSLEVAQIAKSIAIRLNHTVDEYKAAPINTDVIEFAALAHDIGHPPFGHNGEEQLDECMRDSGAFEGNAQSLRIVARLEPKETKFDVEGVPHPIKLDTKDDMRVGINPTARSLASILKYPRRIPVLARDRQQGRVFKGYYGCDAGIYDFVMQNVFASDQRLAECRTIECNIMDLSDDIAYSTYDVEDAFAGGLLDPASIMGAPEEVLDAVAAKVAERFEKAYREKLEFDSRQVLTILKNLFEEVLTGPPRQVDEAPDDIFESPHRQIPLASALIRQGDYIRTRLTATRVGALVESVELSRPAAANGDPIFFGVVLPKERFLEMEVLKNLVFETLIKAPDFQVAKYRGMKIVGDVFTAMQGDQGELLLPRGSQDLLRAWREDKQKADRVICDYICSLTDDAASALHERMHSWTAFPVRPN